LLSNLYFKSIKLINSLKSITLISGLKWGIVATTEHIPVLNSLKNLQTIIDIGANKGQFSLAVKSIYPKAKIFSFEPLTNPANKFKKLFKNNKKINFFQSAIGTKKDLVDIYVSKRDDSSSLLKIGKNQTTIFPGTKESHKEKIKIAPLSYYLNKDDLHQPSLMKIDVQGFELEVIKGCQDLLINIDYIYVECSFVELYEGQALADQIISFLENYKFKLIGIYNTFYDKNGKAIQADFLFIKN